MPALVGAGLVVVTRADEPEPVGADLSQEVEAVGVELPPSGVVVSLVRQGADLPVAVDTETPFLVGADATEAVTRVELWDGAEVVGTYDPPGDRTSLQPSLAWTPAEAGTHLLTARAVDRHGRVGLSNPLWVEVTEDPPVVLVSDAAPDGYRPPAGPSAAPAPDVSIAGRLGVQRPSQVGPALPTVALAVDGCTATATAAPADDEAASLVLLTVLPGGGVNLPMADLGTVPTGGSAKATTVIGGGSQAFLVAAVSDGAVTGWSAPAVADPGDDCPPPGWDGDIALVDQQLHADTDLAEAYLYIEPEPGRWLRVPSDGAVPNLGGGSFDFSGLLPSLPGGYEVHAWGRNGNDVELLGAGSYTPPAPPGDELTFGGFVAPPTTLRWIKPPAKGKLGSFATSGTIDVDPDDDLIGAHQFVWSTPFEVTHGLVQVSFEPLPGDVGPSTYLPVFTCLVPGPKGVFTIDFDAETCSPSLPTKTAGPQEGSYGELVPVDVGLLGGEPNVGTKNPLDEAEGQIYQDPEAPPGDGLPWIDQRVIRVLPMTGDSWGGYRSNDVGLELDRTPKAPPGEFPYDIDLKIVNAPRAPSFRYMACWQFTGWDDEAAADAQAAVEKQQLIDTYSGGLTPPVFFVFQYPHLFWTGLLDSIGGGPICPGCHGASWPGLGSVTVSLGGADCSSDSSFWEDPIGWVASNIVGPIIKVFKALVDLASDGFAYLKQQAVQGLMTVTGCTGKFCETLATAVVNGALLALGVPPTIPNFDQLVALGKGELVNAAVALAEAAGVPCDEASTAATFHGDDDLTCEAAVEAMLDQVAAEVNKSFVAVAKSGGIPFTEDMHVVPWWAGQPGNLELQVTVKPTKYTAEEKGVTCSGGVLTSSQWTAPSPSVTDPDLGKIVLPQTQWSTWPYEPTFLTLPKLTKDSSAEHGYAPATKTYVLAPRGLDLVTVQRTLGVGFPTLPVQVSPFTFYFHQGATFWVNVGGPCARGETLKVTLTNLSGKPTIESVVEG